MVRKGQGDVLVFPKRVVCARREDVHDVVFEFSHRAAQMDHTHTDRKEARRLWDAEKDRSWIKRTYGSIEELMEWIKENRPSIQVLALSMDDHEETIIKMLRLGAASVLPGEISRRLHPSLLSLLFEQVKQGVILGY